MRIIKRLLVYIPSICFGIILIYILKNVNSLSSATTIILLVLATGVFIVSFAIDIFHPEFDMAVLRRTLKDFKDFIGDIDEYRKEIFRLKSAVLDSFKSSQAVLLLNKEQNSKLSDIKFLINNEIQKRIRELENYENVLIDLFRNIEQFEKNSPEIIKQIKKSLEKSLKRAGILIISPEKGEDFNDKEQEIVGRIGEMGSDSILKVWEVKETGFRTGERIIKMAKVIVKSENTKKETPKDDNDKEKPDNHRKNGSLRENDKLAQDDK